MQILNVNADQFGPGYHEAVDKACAAEPSETGVGIGRIHLTLVSSSGGSARGHRPGGPDFNL
jgi:hypothetical protein